MRRLDVFFAAQDAAEKGREADADELFALAATAPTTGDEGEDDQVPEGDLCSVKQHVPAEVAPL